MDGNRRNFFKQPNSQFKRKGVSKQGKWNNLSRKESSDNSQPADTVYRILCPSRKIGGVIGKGGSIIRSLREETQAKITVADSVPGSDERVIIIYSSPTKISSKRNINENLAEENAGSLLQPLCAAQDAILKVHDRIVKEDLFGGMALDEDSDNNAVTARLLVPNNNVGCLLGKRGDVIQRLRSETGANIRVLRPEHLPSCSMATDELVQISGKPDVARRALYEVTTLLHQNPRKDKPPLSQSMPFRGQGFPPPGGPMPHMLVPESPKWPRRESSSHDLPPMPWMGDFGSSPSRFGPDGFHSPPSRHGSEPSAEFSMKILCSGGKIGGVIGKAGFNVKQLQQETGASIHVQEASSVLDDRVICVSAFEALWNPRSQTIEAILQLQNKTSEFSEKGTITTRLLVSSSKVGCLLGQGGTVINEMRRRTKADIRVYSKEDKPKFAAEDEELVQIAGNSVVAKDALAEIASRLRVRTLRDANDGAEPAPMGPPPPHRYDPRGSLRDLGPPPSSAMRPGSSGGYDPWKVGRHEYEPLSYPPLPAPTSYLDPNRSLEESKIHHNSLGSMANMPYIGEVGGARVKYQEPESGSYDYFFESRSNLEHTNARHNHPQQGPYLSTNTHHYPYLNMNSQYSPYRMTGTHQGGSYADINTPQGTYHNVSSSTHGSNRY